MGGRLFCVRVPRRGWRRERVLSLFPVDGCGNGDAYGANQASNAFSGKASNFSLSIFLTAKTQFYYHPITSGLQKFYI